MKKILLSPYPGALYLTRDAKDFGRAYRKLVRPEFDVPDVSDAWGITITLERGGGNNYLVYARRSASTLAHELGHVVLRLFEHLGSDPVSGNGEPFCYMLSHLMDEAARR